MPRQINLSRFTVSAESDETSLNASPVTEIVQGMDLDELEQAHEESTGAHQGLTEGVSAAVELEQIGDAMSEAVKERGGMTTLEVKLIRRRVESALGPLVEVAEPSLVVASAESFSVNPTLATTVSVESIVETLKKVWQWIVEKLKAMGEAIVKFFTSTRSYTQRLKKKAEALRDHIKSLPDSAEGLKGAKLELTGASRYAMLTGKGDKIDEVDVIPEADRCSSQLVDFSVAAEGLMRTGDGGFDVKHTLNGIRMFSSKMANSFKPILGKDTLGEAAGRYFLSVYEEAKLFLRNNGKNTGFFKNKADVLVTVPGVGGNQVQVVWPELASYEKFGEAQGHEIYQATLRINIKQAKAKYNGKDTVAVDLMSKKQMLDCMDSVIDVCASSEKFYETLEKDAKEIAELQRDINAHSNKLGDDPTFLRSMRYGNLGIAVSLTLVNKGIQIRKGFAKVIIEHCTNSSALVAKHAHAYGQLKGVDAKPLSLPSA